MTKEKPLELSQIDRAVIEALDHEHLVELACRLHRLAVEQAERLAMDSTNSSRPPSSDLPFGRSAEAAGRGGTATSARLTSASPPVPGKTAPPSGRRPGKQPGSPGTWRDRPLKEERAETHWPEVCAHCGLPLEMWDTVVRTASAHHVLDLERTPGGLRISCVLHRYAVVRCLCGQETAASPGTGALSFQDGRTRQLLLSEHSLIGPDLASFIAALALRHHQSRARIREFLLSWFDLPLAVGPLDRCIREIGVACEPIVEDLLQEVRAAGVLHADETPWKQAGVGLWRWVVLCATTAVFHIGSRRHEEIKALIGEAILGWLVRDGYRAYRDYARRQRCLAHLIRKGIALAGGLNPAGIRFGEWRVRELRGLIHAVAEGQGHTILNPVRARLKRACNLHRDHQTEKIRQLAREILNDWEAVVAFVSNPHLPATNNDAERALRLAVIARRLSFGTRTDEGSAAYAASLSVVETCRRRNLDPWSDLANTLARARKGLHHLPIPKVA